MTALQPSPDYAAKAAASRARFAAARIGHNGGPALSGPIVAYNGYDLSDPALLEMMRSGGGRTGVSGVPVNEKAALRNSTFHRALSLICGGIGMLPMHLMRRKPDGTTEKAKNHPLFKVLHRKPNGYQSAAQFKSYMQLCALVDGNAYALIVRSRGAVRQLIPLPRGKVTPILSSTFDLAFRYDRPSGGSVTLQQADVFHFRGPLSLDGLKGVSLLDVAADSLGMAHVAQKAASRLLTKGSMAKGALESDQSLGEEAINLLKQSLRDDYGGVDADNDWMVLEEGLKAKLFSGTARDAELIGLMRREAEEMSRFTGVPRPLLVFDETSWGSGIEQLGLYFVTYCLMIWFVIWEEAIWLCLLTEAEQETYYAKINEGALLRGSLKDQAEFFARALGSGGGRPWMKQNEVRSNFDLNPEDDGDSLNVAPPAAGAPRPGTTAADIAKEAVDEPA